METDDTEILALLSLLCNEPTFFLQLKDSFFFFFSIQLCSLVSGGVESCRQKNHFALREQTTNDGSKIQGGVEKSIPKGGVA